MTSAEQPRNPGSDAESKERKYDHVAWEELKRRGTNWAIEHGPRIGVPREVIEQLIREVIAKKTTEQDFGFIYRFMKSQGVGTREELRAIGERAYRRFFEIKEFVSAREMAKEIYGPDSQEWQEAEEANQKEQQRIKEEVKKEVREAEKKDLRVILSPDATFADLFRALGEDSSKEESFWLEMYDNFDEGLVKEVKEIYDRRDSSVKVFDFFKEHGYSRRDVIVYLPIKFKRGKK